MAVDVKIVMNPKAQAAIFKAIDQSIKATVTELRDEIKAKVSVPWPPESSPGDYPRKRGGGLQKAIFVQKMGVMDWAVGVKKLEKGRENLGIWLELGTGKHRQPFPKGSTGSITGEYASPGPGITSMKARPFLLRTVVASGPRIAKRNLRKFSLADKGFFSKIFGRLFR